VQIEQLLLALLGGLFPAALAALPARAQDYPARPVTIVAPFTPGGTTSILARMIGQGLEARLGQSFLIENKPGAGSVIGANAVAKAVPDGYTLLMATSTSMAIDVTLYKNLPYNPASDLSPLALVARTPFVLVVNPSLPVRTVQDLIKLAKDRPGQLSYASAGPGTPHHLYAELLKSMTGIEMAHVPYRGSQPSLNDVVAGHVQLMFVDVAPAVGMLRAGKIRPLRVSTGKRLAAFPEIPPLAEAGVPGFDMASWLMIAAPAKTPRPILDKLHAEAKSVAAMQEVKDWIIADGMLPMDSPSIAELQDFVKSEIVRWSKVVRQAGIAGSQ
jgi:tripartite-type tricarboxylate transporter receptor subunit TctC